MSEYIPNLSAFLDYSFTGNRETRDGMNMIDPSNPPLMNYSYTAEPPTQNNKSEEWQIGYISQFVPPYTGQSGLIGEVPRSEIGFFRLIMTRFIILFMVQEVNKFAKSTMSEIQFRNYDLISPEEMNDFICLMLYMGICRLPTYEMYWRKNFNPFYQAFPRTLMTYERFIVKKYFQVFDNEANEDTLDSGASFSKLGELTEHFSTIFSRAYTPERDLALDENLCSWSEIGGTKLFVPEKNSTYDMNLYALCEGKSGYISSITLHSSSTSEKNIDLVIKLTRDFQYRNHRVYMDNFFTSIPLFDELKKLGIYCCGSQRDVGSGPRGFRVGVKKLKSSEAFMKHNGSINCLELSDTLGSIILTNIHPENNFLPETIDNEPNPGLIKDARQSRIVQDFNNFTVGVDLMNQMTKYYEIDKKSKKWSTKLCIHVLNVAFYNSYCLYKKFCRNAKPKPYLVYLSNIISSLQSEGHEAPAPEVIDAFVTTTPQSSVTPLPPTPTQNQTSKKNSKSSDKITHFPVVLEKRKRCVYCIKQKKRREIMSKCGKCNVPLCHVGCFEKWHND